MDVIDFTDTTLVSKGVLAKEIDALKQSIINGEVPIPIVQPAQTNYAGGVNHWPNSDLSYSTDAATVLGELPTDPGDGNQEAWRHYYAKAGDPVALDAAHALKAIDHSLFAADEGVNTEKPIWNRVIGYVEMGSSAGKDQYDLIVPLLRKLVAPGERWFCLFRIVALDVTPVPSNVQAHVGLWVKNGASQDYATGSDFDLTYQVIGTPGTTSINVRVLAQTDSGVSVLSNILNIPDAPDVLSFSDYIKIYHNAGPGFIEYTIVVEIGGTYTKAGSVRNSQDLQFNYTGQAGQPATGWPTTAGASPLAFAQTRTLRVGSYNGAFQNNQLLIQIPSSYDQSATDVDGQYLRFGLSAPTAVDRHLAIDKFWFSMTLNEWSPDAVPVFSDGTTALPSISPTSGNPGTGTGVGDPPDAGSGGGVCILTRMPVMVKRRHRIFVPFEKTYSSDVVPADREKPYLIVQQRMGMVSEYHELTTQNGITYECNARHRLVLDVESRKFIEAQHVEVGTKLCGLTVKGRRFKTAVIAKRLIPESVEVGTWVLADPAGAVRSGHGMYVAGYSKNSDKGLFSSNAKQLEVA